jgi:integrase/recombinase XerC
MQAIDTRTLTGKRDYAIMALMLTAGLRTIEITRSDITDMRTLGEHTVLYVQGKGKDSKGDFVKLAPQVEAAIRSYLNARGKAEANSPLFTSTSNNSNGERMTTRSISGIVKARLIAAGYDSEFMTAHSLRHTAATINLLSGATLEETQQLLRHSNINTTLIYAHHLDRMKNNSEQRIAAAIF